MEGLDDWRQNEAGGRPKVTAKTSAEMREALRLVRAGLNGREAARQAGVREESLYRNAEYKEIRRTKAGAHTK
jgi:hypothetical protein